MSARIPYADFKKLSPAAKAKLSAAVARKSGKKSSGKRGNTSTKHSSKSSVNSHKSYSYKSNWGDQAYTAMGGLYNLAPAILPSIMKVAGFGDYSMPGFSPRKNSLMAAITANGPPALQSTSARSFIVRHREYLGDVITGSTSAFNVGTYSINPALQSTFPWLSTIAQNFEQYKIHGMIFEFKSTSADALNSTNTALGTVVMATEYNSASATFSSKQQMENHEFASSARQSCSMLHPIECKPSVTTLTELYTRTGPVPSDDDIRFYDLGQFSIATVGQQGSNVNIGELWVTYEVELLKPQLPDESSIVATDHVYATSGISTSNYFGTNTTNLQDGIGCTFSATSITFPSNISSGQYLVVFQFKGTSTAQVFPTFTFVNCEIVNNIWNNVTSNSLTNSGNTSLVGLWTGVVQIDASGATITLSGGTLPTSPTSMDCLITRVSSQYLQSTLSRITSEFLVL